MRHFYRKLIGLRRSHPALALLSEDYLDAIGCEKQRVLLVRRWNGPASAALVLHFDDCDTTLPLPLRKGHWTKLINSGGQRWLGARELPGELDSDGEVTLTLGPHCFAVYSADDDTY